MRANIYYLRLFVICSLLSVRVRNICPDINMPDVLNGLVFYRGPETRDIELEEKIKCTLFEKMSRLEATSLYVHSTNGYDHSLHMTKRTGECIWLYTTKNALMISE